MTRPQSLTDKLLARIEKEGPISVAEYMDAALSDPDFGYYMSREPFGRGGDFTTAPEISQMFGELIGVWIAEVWISMDRPVDVAIVEPGPGRGTLMADVLRTLARALPALHETASIHLVEMSPRLKAEQASALNGQNVTWHETIETLPRVPMIIIANEFFDALPIHQYVRSHDGWHERLVGAGAGNGADFGFCLADAPVIDDGCVPQTNGRPAMIETIAETRPDAADLVVSLAKKLLAQQGAMLIVDYGHEKSAFGDTFQSVRNHKPQHVLIRPGEADLTAHVDFEALVNAATFSGLKTSNVVSQGSFLKSLGIEARAARLTEGANSKQAEDIGTALERLTADDRMGLLFKALSMFTPNLAPPPGFESAEEGS